MLSLRRQDRIEADHTWDRAFGRAYSRALAETLVAVVSAIEEPTVGDMLKFVAEGRYDLDDHFRVDVPIGSLVGQPGKGPSVGDVVAVLEGLDPDELDTAIESRLASLLEA